MVQWFSLLLLAASSRASAPAAACRNATTWPFSAATVWNTPIGAAAVYTPAALFPGAAPPHDGVFIDEDYFVATAAGDPLIPWYSQGHWNATPDCEQFPWAPQVGPVPWPAMSSPATPARSAHYDSTRPVRSH